MNKHLAALVATFPAIVIALASAGHANAQQEGEVRILEEVRVVAPRLVRHTERTPTGGRIESVQLTRRVSARDLDLTRQADVMELEQRINETARQACDYLAEMFPLASDETPDCFRRAVDGAMAQVDEAVAAANP